MPCFRASPSIAVAAGLGLIAGCLQSDDTVGTTEQAAGSTSCPFSICGTNHPLLSEPFHELSEIPNVANAEGMKLLGIYFGGVAWQVDVVGNELQARRGSSVLSGANVTGGVLRVTNSHGVVYNITVTEVNGTTNLYPAGSGKTWSYVLKWTSDTVRRPVNLCSDPESLMGEQDTLFQLKTSAVLFEGERYDADKLEVLPGSTSWFNIGCAGHMLAKMHLTHHTASSSAGSYKTIETERQTIMKMFAADYCGTGHAFTVGGTPLSWTDDHGWLPHVYDVVSYDVKLEARWDKDGATCLETPRLDGTTDPDAIAAFGTHVGANIYDLIAAECALPPPCSLEDPDVNKTAGKHLVSGTPH